jgi:hypothetical protein
VTAYAAHTKVILAVLADGEWHDRDELVAAGAAAVPPGVAFRAGEAERNRTRGRPNGPGPRVRGEDADSIRSGARKLACRNLSMLAVGRPSRGDPPKVERDGGRYRLRRRL